MQLSGEKNTESGEKTGPALAFSPKAVSIWSPSASQDKRCAPPLKATAPGRPALGFHPPAGKPKPKFKILRRAPEHPHRKFRLLFSSI